MKTTIFIGSMLLLILSCTSQKEKPMSQQEKDQIRNEVMTVTDKHMMTIVNKDLDGLMNFCQESPEWITLNADGTSWDYKTARQAFVSILDSTASFKWTRIRQEFIIISRDLVISALFSKEENIMKSGDKISYDSHAYTMVFRKISDQWKLIYSHDSGIPVIEKAALVKK
jgi:ketosteroid isomerase-like protein